MPKYLQNLHCLVCILGIVWFSPCELCAEPPSKELESLVVDAFSRTHQGWSVDEVLLDDTRRDAFLQACVTERSETKGTPEQLDRFCEALLHVRKSGGKLPKATRRDDRKGHDQLDILAEICARRLQDARDCHTDAILVNTAAREQFDRFAREMDPQVDLYLIRKSAIRLRKTRRLEPELLSRVTDWKRHIDSATVADMRLKLGEIPDRPGIYLFRDTSGYLYIGQAANLRARLQQHLLESDRAALGKYLQDSNEAAVQIELHVFEVDSPGEDLRTRRAYESELIRTRKPKLNLAP